MSKALVFCLIHVLAAIGLGQAVMGTELVRRHFDQLFSGDDPGELFTVLLPYDALAPTVVRFNGYFENRAAGETGVRFALLSLDTDFQRLPGYGRLPIQFEERINLTPSHVVLHVEGGGCCDHFQFVGDLIIEQMVSTLVRTGSVWKYLPVTNDIGNSWRTINYDDSPWPSGPAQLGYGDQDEATQIPFYYDENFQKNISTYFRRAFYVTNAARYTNLIVRLLRDDGAVVYLNGVEVFRSNMPEGPVSWKTTAIVNVQTPEENYVFISTNAPGSLLIDGLNVLAVEIHQQNGTSQDISFDLGLAGIIDSDFPRLTIGRIGTEISISWPREATGFSLYGTTSLEPPVAWERIQAPVSDDGLWKTVRLGAQEAKVFYRLSNE